MNSPMLLKVRLNLISKKFKYSKFQIYREMVIRPYFWMFIRPLFFLGGEGGSEVVGYKISLFWPLLKCEEKKSTPAKSLFPDLPFLDIYLQIAASKPLRRFCARSYNQPSLYHTD